MTRVRRWVRRGALAGSLVSLGVLGASVVAAPASASQPERTAWWGAPDPNTPDGGLHIAVAPQQILAYGAVAIPLPSDGTGTLELALAGSEGSGSLQACPTESDSWQSGGGQPTTSAPGFDCSTHAYQGLASSDGKTITFLVDGSAETTPGTLSLAIVPVQTTAAPAVGTETGTDMTPPYNVEIAKPDPNSFTQTGGSSTSSGSLPPPPPPPASSTQSSAPAAGGVPASGPVNVPPAGSDTTSMPTAPDTGSAPQLASQGTTPTNGVTPVAQKSSTDNNRARNAALALLALLFLALVMGGTPTQRPPRRIGRGGAHRAAPAPAAAAAAGGGAADATSAQAQALLMAQLFASRGLGRFAKPRVGPPRPLT